MLNDRAVSSEYNYCLWLNGKKIYSANDIKENFDLPSLRGYFLGGSLIGWLKSHSGGSISDYLENLSVSDLTDINSHIEYAFGLRDKPAPDNVFAENSVNFTENSENALTSGYPFQLLFSSFSFSSLSSFTMSSFLMFPSFSYSFGFGSFSEFLTSSLSYLSLYNVYISSGGSFFYFNEFFEKLFTNSFTGLFTSSFSSSFNINKIPEFKVNSGITVKDIFKAAFECTLNRYGYGIHLI